MTFSRDVHLGKDLGLLKGPGEPHACNDVGVQVGDIGIIESHGAGRGMDEARDNVRESGLACTVRADQSVDLSFPDRYVQALKGGETAKIDAQFLGCKECSFSHHLHPARAASFPLLNLRGRHSDVTIVIRTKTLGSFGWISSKTPSRGGVNPYVTPSWLRR